MTSIEGNTNDCYRKELVDWSSDGEYQGSEDNYNSNVEWNGGSSVAGEASGVSEATEEEEEESRKKRPKEKKNKKDNKPKNSNNIKYRKLFNVDDVGTDDESQRFDDTAGKSDFTKSNISEMSDISDIEDQISSAHSKFADDKQSLNSVIVMVDEVTVKGENLAKRASETSVAFDKEKFNKTLYEDSVQLKDGDDIYDVLHLYGSKRKGVQNHTEKDSSGIIEYIASSDDEIMNVSENLQSSVDGEHITQCESQDSKCEAVEDDIEDEECVSSRASNRSIARQDSDKSCISSKNLKKRQSSSEKLSNRSCSHRTIETFSEGESIQSNELNKLETYNNQSNEEGILKDEDLKQCEEDQSGNIQKYERSDESRSSSPEFNEPECRQENFKHVCCFINVGGGGDDGGRESEIISRLKKLRDDISNMREELSHARKECKKESEEVAKLIEEAVARNKAAEEQEVKEEAVVVLATPPQTPPTPTFGNYILEEGRPQVGYQQPQVGYQQPQVGFQQPVVTRAQIAVPIPTAILEDRLRATRQTASTSYRESLQQLELMVEKEMASIQDSMTRLEPLNKIAAEWDHLQQVRSRSMTFMRDYRMEMVTKEMCLQADKKLQNQSIQIN